MEALFVGLAAIILFVGVGVFMCIRINYENKSDEMEDLSYLEQEGVEFIRARLEDELK